MMLQYFKDTDTLYIEFRSNAITESRDLDENTLLEFDAAGSVCAMTMEHASLQADDDLEEAHRTLEAIPHKIENIETRTGRSSDGLQYP